MRGNIRSFYILIYEHHCLTDWTIFKANFMNVKSLSDSYREQKILTIF